MQGGLKRAEMGTTRQGSDKMVVGSPPLVGSGTCVRVRLCLLQPRGSCMEHGTWRRLITEMNARHLRSIGGGYAEVGPPCSCVYLRSFNYFYFQPSRCPCLACAAR